MTLSDETRVCFPQANELYLALEDHERLREFTKAISRELSDDLQFALVSKATALIADNQNPALFMESFLNFVRYEIEQEVHEPLPATDRVKHLWNAFWHVVEQIVTTVQLQYLSDCVAVLERHSVGLKDAYDNVVRKRITLEYKEIAEEIRKDEEIKKKKKEEKEEEARKKKEAEKLRKEEEDKRNDEKKSPEKSDDKRESKEDRKKRKEDDKKEKEDGKRREDPPGSEKKEPECPAEPTETEETMVPKADDEDTAMPDAEADTIMAETEKKDEEDVKEKDHDGEAKKEVVKKPFFCISKSTSDEDAMRKHIDTSILGLLGVFRVMQNYCGECPDRSLLKSRVLLLLGKMLPIDSRSLANYSRQRGSFTLPSVADIKADMDNIGEPIHFMRDEEAIKDRSGLQILADLDAEDRADEDGVLDVGQAVRKQLVEELKEEGVHVEEKEEGKEEGAEDKEEVQKAYKDTKIGKIEEHSHNYLWKAFHIMQEPDKALENNTFDDMDSMFNTVLGHFEKHKPIHEVPDANGRFPEIPFHFIPNYAKFQMQVRSEPFQTKVLSAFCIFFNSLELDSRKDEQDNPRSILRLDDTRKNVFQKLKKRTWVLLENVSPSFSKLLAAHINKETDWVVWKKGNCKEAERFYFRTPNPLEPQQKKRRLESSKPQLEMEPFMVTLLDTLNQKVEPLAEVQTTGPVIERSEEQKEISNAFFEKLWDEDKPENGIEDEYKMKNNKVFMWQARRLYCRHHLSTHGEMTGLTGTGAATKNDFMGSVAKVLGKPIEAPAPSPSPQPLIPDTVEGNMLPLADEAMINGTDAMVTEAVA